MVPTDKQLLDSGKYVRCACHNVISVESNYCKYCKNFNAANSANQCPTCGQTLGSLELIESQVLMIEALNAEIVDLKSKIPT